ncbi:MAG: STING domain-containing protein [Bacteroidota bacterium]
MTDLKPKIFIGSSKAGYPIAEKVKQNLSDVGDCFLWQDPDVWEPNKSTFDNLLRMARYFDFGVFVATADDLTLTNDNIVIEPRDNVILEMALFVGSMGRHKSFLLVEEGIKLPSDFNGIYMPRFKPNDAGSIKNACDGYANMISEHYQLGHLSLYPTTALAIGYYKNFVAGMVESIQNMEPIDCNEKKYTELKLNIVIPKDLSGLVREKAALFYKKNGFTECTIKTKFRKHPAWAQLDDKLAPVGMIYDMPSTLTGIDDAIELILEKNYHGRTKMQTIIEQRELNNFRRVLQLQIDKSPFAKSVVNIVDEF